MSCTADAEANLGKAEERIREAAGRSAQVVCLQELFRSQYFCRVEDHSLFDLAESIPGPTTMRLGELAKELSIVVVASLFERRAAGVYHNTAAVLGADGELRGSIAKCTFPTIRVTTRSSTSPLEIWGFLTSTHGTGRIGVQVCWDQWYPEGARITSMLGASLLFYPTAIGWHPHEKVQFGAAQLDAWRTIQRAHAIANGVYVAAVNRVGFEGSQDGGLEFWGHSFVADPFGQVLAEAGVSEEILIVEIDPARCDEVRRNWPFFRDRRIDAYGQILQRWSD